MQNARRLWMTLAGAAAIAFGTAAHAQDEGPIRVGDINSYESWGEFTGPYKNGLTLALEEINAAGGVNGRQIELVTRDDGGDPEAAVAAAEDLIAQENVHMLAGTYLSSTGLAVARVAGDKQVVFLAADPMTDRLVWQEGNRYTFRLRASTHMQAAMLAREAADSEAETWAVVAPDFEFGRNEIRATPIFSDHMPIRVLRKDNGHYELETEFTDYHLNAAGSVHGGMLAAFLDCGLAGGGASAVNNGEGRYGVTMTMTVNYIRGAGPGRMRCVAEVTGGGKTTKFVEAKLHDDGDGPIASASGAVRVIELD